MEFLLPLALKFFPNMLPSTFQDKLKKEEMMKRELRARIEIAGVMQNALGSMAKGLRARAAKRSGQNDDECTVTAAELTSFVEKSRHGQVDNTDISRFAKVFGDEFLLDNVSRPELVNMCQFMHLRPYGADAFLRYQLRSHMRTIRRDDARILYEGVGSLNRVELSEACAERGMRATGLSQRELATQLEQWLDLSSNKTIPISLVRPAAPRARILARGPRA